MIKGGVICHGDAETFLPLTLWGAERVEVCQLDLRLHSIQAGYDG